MPQPDKIHLELIKLEGGERLLRLSDPSSGLVLEKKIDSNQPVARQKQQLLGVFDAALAQAKLTAA
jgi:hypothetical protein